MDAHVAASVDKAPPFSEEQIATLSRLLQRPPDTALMRWRVKLSCGHIVETTRHVSTVRPTDHGSSSQHCAECGEDGRIIAYEPIGRVADYPSPPAPPPAPTPARRKAIARRMAKLEADLAELRRGAAIMDGESPQI